MRDCPAGAAGYDFCWAQILGGCRGGPSKEHVISDGILEFFSDLTILGLPWCRTEPKHVGPASLVARNLCVAHNSQLSGTDAAAILLFRALHNQSDPQAPATGEVIAVRGSELERWFLKTSINFMLQERTLPSFPYRSESGRVPVELVRLAFGLDVLAAPLGLYWRGDVGQKLIPAVRFDFASLLVHDDTVGGFGWSFREHSFVYWFHPSERLAVFFPDRPAVFAGEPSSGLVHRVQRFNLTRLRETVCVVSFDWSGAS